MTNDAITDVPGVRVGHCTVRRDPDVRTGVTVVVPPELPLFAGAHRLNGNGELTGLEWLRESGLLTTPVALTNTHSVGVVRDALVELARREDATDAWALPVVGETWDGFLNDIDGMHVTREHVAAALAAATAGPVEQGCVGAGTGTICHGFKGGIGSASRRAGDLLVGVLVQANHGRRSRLVVATDAPLLPHQCEKLAQRAALGVARTGGAGENSSGDLMLCFATGNRGLGTTEGRVALEMLPNDALDELFYATIEATEAAIVHALLAAETTSGREGRVAYALPADRFEELMRARR